MGTVCWEDSDAVKWYFSKNHTVSWILFWMGLLAGVCFMLPAMADPIPIDSIETLQKIGNDDAYPLDGIYIVTQDIDASDTANWNDGAGFDPIGNFDTETPTPFTGFFDGQGHTISNLTINRQNEEYVGLFGFVGSMGRIENLGLLGGSVIGNFVVGGLAGSNMGMIKQCYSTGLVSGAFIVGGLAGKNDGMMTRCHSVGIVNGYDDVGGLVGANNGAVTQCFDSGAVSGAESIGGVIGLNSGGVMQCFAASKVSGINNVSGLVGANQEGTITECYAAGPVSGTLIAGGLVAINDAGTITSSFWDTETTGQSISEGGTGITTEELLQSTTFIAAGWDYAGVWTQLDGQTIPYFSDTTAPGTTYALTVSVEGNGTVSSTGGTYPTWSLIELMVTPEAGNTFAGWLGDGLSPSIPLPLGNLRVFMYGDFTLKALFLPDAPIHIYTVEDLQKIGHDPYYPLSWDYLIENDIDASATATWNDGAGFSPIGSAGYPFTGSINGLGHVISDLSINRQHESYVGLVGHLTSPGHLENVGLTGESIVGDYNVGGLVGHNSGTITNCFTTGTISGDTVAGGLTGTNKGTVMQCYAICPVFGVLSGGLIGVNYSGTVTQCYAMGAVSGLGNEIQCFIGGLVGDNTGTVTHCHATGKVSGNEYIGGLIGRNMGTVTQCYATGVISGIDGYGCENFGTGGLIGANYSGTVIQCYATGAVSRLENDDSFSYAIGGLIGCNDNRGAVTQCYATGPVTNSSGSIDVGGLIGANAGMVTQCYAMGAIIRWGGGLIGSGTFGEVLASYWDTETSGQIYSDGGIGKTTAEMMQQATFEDWDFVSVWGIVESTAYPFLRSMTVVDPSAAHSADPNGDGWISLSELIRIIQFFNSEGYHCESGTEDGYAPGPGDVSCGAHDSDYSPQDWHIGLAELLRVIQFYNSGGYHGCAGEGTEDGYCPN